MPDPLQLRRGDHTVVTVTRTSDGRDFTNEDLVVHVRDGSAEHDRLWATSVADEAGVDEPPYLLDLTGTDLEAEDPVIVASFGDLALPVGDYWCEASSLTSGQRARVIRFPFRVEARIAVP